MVAQGKTLVVDPSIVVDHKFPNTFWTFCRTKFDRGIEHAVVGSFSEHSTELYGEMRTAHVISPSSLPEYDAVVLDCEGSEGEILRDMAFRPRVIIVETHAFLDSLEDAIRSQLTNMGYEIVARGVEWGAKGVFVLTAVRQDNTTQT